MRESSVLPVRQGKNLGRRRKEHGVAPSLVEGWQRHSNSEAQTGTVRDCADIEQISLHLLKLLSGRDTDRQYCVQKPTPVSCTEMRAQSTRFVCPSSGMASSTCSPDTTQPVAGWEAACRGCNVSFKSLSTRFCLASSLGLLQGGC